MDRPLFVIFPNGQETQSYKLQRGDQVKKKGRSFDLVDRLAKNSQSRACLRQSLQSHIEQLRDMVNINPSFNLEQKSRIIAAIDDLEQVVATKLDHLEQAIRELLQIVC